MNATTELEHLITALAKLPAIGRRSAERIAVNLLGQRSRVKIKGLVDALQRADENIGLCPVCGIFKSNDQEQCRVCTDSARDKSFLCVVESPGDALLIERTGAFPGCYHVIAGRISPMTGQGAASIGAEALLRRIRKQKVKEVLLAMSSDVESDATSAYLRDVFSSAGVRVTRMAMGVPAGSGVSYADERTLNRAIAFRQDL